MGLILGLISVVGFAGYVLYQECERLRKRLNQAIETQQHLAARVAELERRAGWSRNTDLVE